MCYEAVFQGMKAAAEEALENTPELRSMVVICDWQVGKNDFPPAAMYFRPGAAMSMEMMTDCMGQTQKALMQQAESLRAMISAAEKYCRELENRQVEASPPVDTSTR